jgi:cytosolic carboxypeptidase protein 2/3
MENIAFVIDFHGHSKKYNSFIFACTGDPIYPFRVYPYIFSKHSSIFSIKDCTYDLTPDKERTARIQLFRQINKPQIFTLETSFFGYEDTNGKKYRWTIKNLLEVGEIAA